MSVFRGLQMDDAIARLSYRIVECDLNLRGLLMQALMEKKKIPTRPLLGEEERRTRLEKMKGLRCLRSYGSCLRFDPSAQFHEVIDCTVLLEWSNDSDEPGTRAAASEPHSLAILASAPTPVIACKAGSWPRRRMPPYGK
jgi:hypothetical protein